MPPSSCEIFWIFGLSGAGKSTVASALVEQLCNEDIPVLALDGDTLRAGLCYGLGFSEEDCTENLRRAAELARLGTASGLCVVASFITPLESHRHLIKSIVAPERISMIFANAPLDACRQRDVKGLYARAQVGLIQQLSGVNSPFEVPAQVELDLPTSTVPPEVSVQLLWNFAQTRLTMVT